VFDDDATKTVRCRRCGVDVEVPAFLVDTAHNWSRREFRRADEVQRVPHAISASELVACAACTQLEETERQRQRDQETYTTSAYQRDVKAGSRNPTALAWLRDHGYGLWLDRVLADDDKPQAQAQPRRKKGSIAP
jgi:hypothetical protein